MANYELIGLNEAGPDLRAPTAADTGTVAGDVNVTGTVTAATYTGALASAVTATTQSASDNSTKVATTAYVDTSSAAHDSLEEVLVVGNTSGANNLIIDSGQVLTTNTINETTAASGVTIDSVLLKDNTVTATTYSGALASTVTATTQAASDNSTKVATTAYVDTSSAAHDSLPEVLVVGNTTGGTDLAVSTGDDITFADNSKAIFGAGSDLQIYHDGSNSYVTDTSGTGDLYVRGTNLRLTDNDGTLFLYGANNAATTVYYAGSARLSTTSTGIDVTGTATMDGLTVDGLAQISAQTNGAYALRVGDAAGSAGGVVGIGKIGINPQGASAFTYTGTEIRATENSVADYKAILSFHTRDTSSDVEPLERLRINYNGDISFYEDTGTTPKFFWDASAESLGIGTTSPASKLHVQGTGTTSMQITAGAGNVAGIYLGDAGGIANGRLSYSNADNSLQLFTSAAERMRIDSSGNVGIGTTIPSGYYTGADNLVVHQASGEGGITISTASDTAGALYFADGTSGDAEYRGGIAYSHSADVLSLVSGGTTKVSIDSSGNVGIGTTTPSSLLDLYDVNTGGEGVKRLLTITGKDGGDVDNTDGVGILLKVPKGSTSEVGASIDAQRSSNNDSNSETSLVLSASGNDSTLVPNLILEGASGSELATFAGDVTVSGGVYLGGTVAANKLDDYEEGTWTPVLADASTGGNEGSGTSVSASYTKIGRMVYVTIFYVNANTTGLTAANDIYIRGLPFTSESGVQGYSEGSVRADLISYTSGAYLTASLTGGTSHIRLAENVTGDNDSYLAVSTISSGNADIFIALSYQTA